MNKEPTLSVPAIIIIIASIIVAALLALGAVYFFVIRKNKIRKEVRNLDRRFQYYHALLIGQDAQYVKRLEIVSRTNLLYVEIHTKFLKHFKEIRDKHDSNAQNTINRLMDMLDEKHYKQAKDFLPEANEIILDYVKAVNDLNNSLLKVIKPEEDCRQSSLALKERLRHLKQDYYSKQSDLILLETSFEKVFALIDSKFEQFETFIESAQYDDANNILPEIESILTELSKALAELPNLCISVTDLLPNKISSLESTARAMEVEDYPLHHLCVRQYIAEMHKELEEAKANLQRFDLRGIQRTIDAMNDKIDEFFAAFEEEKAARTQFEEQNESVYSTVNLIERRFIKLCNTIPEVTKIYLINEEHTSKINEIQTEINKVGALKRSLDTFIHSTTKQPYSSLVGKMNELKEASDSIISDLDEFDNYLTSLKTDCEEAYELVFTFFKKLKVAEKELRDINISRLSEKYSADFDRSYELLNEINDLLFVTPINVDEVNKNVAELYEVSNNILDGGSIDQDAHLKTLAENAILYANKARAHLGDIDQLVAQAEAFFKEGDFEQAYIIAGNALKKVKANNER